MIYHGLIMVIFIGIAIYGHTEDEERFEKETRNEENRLKEEQAEKERLINVLPLVKRDLKQTNDLLNTAYAINIIPAKYRNLCAVYFLHKYISTSTASLSEALNQCALDEISQKLNVLVAQNQELIIKQAHSNALNKQLVRQNDEILKHAISIENNTALAAQYSQIAAINTDTIATIQGYYFFKNGG